MSDCESWIDIWESSGDWTRAISRHLGSRERVRDRSEMEEYASLDDIAFQQLARTVERFATASLIVADPEQIGTSLRLIHLLKRRAGVPLVMVVLRANRPELRWDCLAAGATLIFDEFWQARIIARLVRHFSARHVARVLSLDEQIWKNLPWTNVLSYDSEHEDNDARTNDR